MSAKAIKYAEGDLGVHDVYDLAVERRDALIKLFDDLNEERSTLRLIKERIATREVEVYVEEGGKHASMSKTALNDHTKVKRQLDPELKKARSDQDSTETNINGLETEVRLHEHSIKIAEARMIELGGYLNYLAAVKSTQPTRVQTQQDNKDKS